MSGNITRERTLAREQQLKQATTLADREAEVTALKEFGLTHTEIADELGIEKGTVDSHANRARMKYSQAYHTVKQLEATYDGKIPDMDNYTGMIFYYDPKDEFSREVLLPALRAEYDHKQFVDLRVSESRQQGGILVDQPVSNLPALLYCEGGPMSLYEGKGAVLEQCDADIAETLGYEHGYLKPDEAGRDSDGWDFDR